MQTIEQAARASSSFQAFQEEVVPLLRRACPHYKQIDMPMGVDARARHSGVPIKWGGRVIGQIDVDCERFSELDRMFLDAVADITAARWAREYELPKCGGATLAVDGAWPVEAGVRPVAAPIYSSSTYEFESMDALEAYHDRQDRGYIYTRWGNPTIRAAEEAIATLEGAETSVLTASGMAAISNAVLSVAHHGDEVVSALNTYGGTNHLFTKVFPHLGIDVRFVELDALHDIARHLSDRTRVVYFEPVTNPTMRVVDVARAAAQCRRRGVRTIVDNTVASPIFLRPLELGVDIVVHSATKYLGGHSDLIAGVASGSRELMDGVRTLVRYLGANFNPREAALLLRGIKTLPLRVRQQDASARRIAIWLLDQAGVRRVWHPMLPSHPDHTLALRQMNGTGCLVTFELENAAQARLFVDSLTLFRKAASLGGVESLVTIPVLSSHWNVSEETLRGAGVTPATVRMSVGVEDPDDLLRDIDLALTASRAATTASVAG